MSNTLYFHSFQEPEIRHATAVLNTGSVEGVITFTQDNIPTGNTNITGQITGLTPG